MTAVTVQSDFGAQENEICHCLHFSLFYLPWSDGTRCLDLSFLSGRLGSGYRDSECYLLYLILLSTAQGSKNPLANAGDVGLVPGSGRPRRRAFCHFLEEEMTTLSSVLAWKILWLEEPKGLQCVGLQRVRHDLATATKCVRHEKVWREWVTWFHPSFECHLYDGWTRKGLSYLQEG